MQKCLPIVNKKLKKGETVLARIDTERNCAALNDDAGAGKPVTPVDAVTSATLERNMHFIRTRVIPEKK